MKKAIAILAILMFFASGIGLVTADETTVPIVMTGTESYCQVTFDTPGPQWAWDITLYGNGGYNDCNVGTDLQEATSGAWWDENEAPSKYADGATYFCYSGHEDPNYCSVGGSGKACDVSKYWFLVHTETNLEKVDIELTATDDKLYNTLKPSIASTWDFSMFSANSNHDPQPSGQLQAVVQDNNVSAWGTTYQSILSTSLDQMEIPITNEEPIDRYYRFQTGITEAEQHRAGDWSINVPFTVSCHNDP